MDMKKKCDKGFLERQGYEGMKGRLLIALLIIIIGLIGFFVWLSFFRFDACSTEECFTDAMTTCKNAYWTKEDSQAAWRYRILGSGEEDSCLVEVTLTEMKSGTIDIEKLQNKHMVCDYLKTDTRWPETTIERCKGELKEELQEIIIQRMHKYLLENVGEINEGLTNV